MFERLTLAQRSQISYYLTMRLTEVSFIGVDEQNNPVLLIEDTQRRMLVALHPNGWPRETAGFPRPLTNIEWYAMPSWHRDLLAKIHKEGSWTL